MRDAGDILLDVEYDSNGYNSIWEYDEAVKAMEQYAEQFKPKWIDVSDVLPGKNQIVLIPYDGFHELSIFREGKFKKVNHLGYYKNVSHWTNVIDLP